MTRGQLDQTVYFHTQPVPDGHTNVVGFESYETLVCGANLVLERVEVVAAFLRRKDPSLAQLVVWSDSGPIIL